MPANIDGILETALYAADLDQAEDFYTRILGLEIITKAEGRHVFFRCGRGMLLIFNPAVTEKVSPNAPFPAPPHGARGPGHTCFSVPEEKLEEAVAELTAQGIDIEADFCWPNGVRSVYFRDPAGNSLEYASPKLWNL